MGLFDFFKKKPTIQEYLDGFFKNMAIVDVIAASDIPIISINGIKRRSPADYFFEDYAKHGHPYRIDSFNKDIDTIFWIFDAFCVLEINASDDRAKQFMVLQHTSEKMDELAELVGAQINSIKMLNIKGMLFEMRGVFDPLMFKKSCEFHLKHQDQAISIIKSKYY